ncbi:hypothetical protein Q4595_18225, partial [Wenyingzhuangia sp. 1_MG-2023]|nr:hypothetical protein [Wenyingzhuangia sp. 1_MG-2023]
CQSFNDVADAVIDWHQEQGNPARKEYVAFPDHLKGAYQSFTEADISALRAAGYDQAFADVKTGVHAYMNWLNQR